MLHGFRFDGIARLAVLAGVAACLLGAAGLADSSNAQKERNGVRVLRAYSAVDARGKQLTLRAAPRRIVSLSPGTTEMLFALGLKGRIVADTTYCNYPPEARNLPKIGDVNTSSEKVLAQRPDLVVAGVTANRRAIEPLEKLGLPIFAVDAKTFAEAYAAFESLGKLTGQTRQAKALVEGMKAKVHKVTSALAREAAKPKVLVIVQADPLMVVGPGNFMDELVTLAGGNNVGRVTGKDWGPISPERVVALRPDILFVGPGERERLRSRAGWSSIPAIKNNALYSLPGDEAARPGPRLADALLRIAQILHPRAFSAPR